MDWSKCILCQQDQKDSSLVDPLNNKNNEVCGHAKLVENIYAFRDNGISFPKNLLESFDTLDSGEGILTKIKEHKGKWHKTCALEMSNSK